MRPTGQLRQRVLAFLKFRQHVTDKEVAKFAGIARQTAYHYLDALCHENLAHRTRAYNPKGSWLVTFNFGPDPVAPKAPEKFDSRVTVKAWTALAIVDPWMLPRAFFQSNGVNA